MHGYPRPLEHRRSAEHPGRAGYEPARLRQLIETRPDGLGRTTSVDDDGIGANDGLTRTADQFRHHDAPAFGREKVRRLMSQLEADESVALKQSRIALSHHGTFQQAGIDDPMDLPQRYTRDRRSLVRGHEKRLVRGHLKSFHGPGKNINCMRRNFQTLRCRCPF